MGEVLATFGTFTSPVMKWKGKKRVIATRQSINLLKKKAIDVDTFTQTIVDLAKKFGFDMCYISKYSNEIKLSFSKFDS